MKKILAIIFTALLLFSFTTKAQQKINDSLTNLLAKAKEDTGKVLLLISAGQQVEGTDPELAKQYYTTARALSKKINYPVGELKFYSNYTAALNMQGKFDSSLLLNLESVEVTKKTGNKEHIAICIQNTAATYMYLEQYEKATEYNLEAARYFEEMKDSLRLSILYSNMGVVYREIKLYEKALLYQTKALLIARQKNKETDLGYALASIGVIYTDLKKFDTALLHLQEGLTIARKLNNLYLVQACLLNLSEVYLKTGNYPLLGQYSAASLVVRQQLGDSSSIQNALYGLAVSSFHAKYFKQSKNYCEQGLQNSLQQQNKEFMQNFYELLSNLALVNNDLNEFDRFKRLADAAGEERLNASIQKNIQVLDKKFETDKKNNQILQLNKDHKIKSLWNYILMGAFGTLLLISLLSYRNYRHKQQLQQQRRTDLEKEKQLLAAEAMLQGQEEERSRLSKDLHDGLGGMLSGIKYSFSNMKDNLIMTPENMQGFERGLDMLDSSINELRRVAHSMMPEALMKFGLNAALKDFCTSTNNSGVLKVIYQSHDADHLDISPTASVTIYRIVQELLNNSIKHAAATQVLVQLNKEDNKLLLTVEDDGKGFDIASLQDAKVRPDGSVGRGIGWTNIKSRLDYLKGKLDIQSAPGKGTSVNIEIAVTL